MLTKDDEQMWDLVWKIDLVFPWNLSYWNYGLKVMTYLLKNFKCFDKFEIFFLQCMFCGLIMISLNFVIYISLKSSFSFMFDDFDAINLAPRQFVYIVLCYIEKWK
jgi:hypothetical protein